METTVDERWVTNGARLAQSPRGAWSAVVVARLAAECLRLRRENARRAREAGR